MNKGKRNLALGAFIAAGVGYAAGILTAPKSGKDTRKNLQHTAALAKKEAEKNLKALNTELGEIIEKGKHKAKDVKDQAKKELVEALANAQLAKEKVREILSAIHEGDADDKDLKKAVKEAKKARDHLKTYVTKPKKAV